MTLAKRPRANAVASDDQPADPNVTTTIERAGAIDPLQPIVVALRRELGQNPSVSRELDEVSKDVQKSIMHMRKGLHNDSA